MLKIPIHAHHFTTSTYTPVECSKIDFVGPFPDGGYILVIVCTFTRSDNGSHFIADLIREFLLLIGVKECLTLAYSKEENAIVERYNKEINRHLRALTYDNSS